MDKNVGEAEINNVNQTIMFFKNNKLIISLIIALLLRLVAINQSLWLDEAIGAWAVKNFSYTGIVNNFLLFDNHPPLYYLVLKFWTDMFGYSEVSLRMPSVLFGVGTIYFTYKITGLVFESFLHSSDKESDSGKIKNDAKISSINSQSPFTGSWSMIVALILATSPLHVYYSQEARMYSMAAFVATSSMYFFLRSFQVNNKSIWAAFSISLIGLLFSDYMPVFLLPVYGLIGLTKLKNKKWLKYLLLSILPLVILGILWLPTFVAQSKKGTWLLQTLPAWRELAGGASIRQAVILWMKFVLGRVSFSPKWIYYSMVGIGSIPFVISYIKLFNKSLLKRNIAEQILILWFFLPLTLGFTISFLFPAFNYFRYLYILPAFYLVSVLGINEFKNKKIQKILVSTILLVNITGLAIYYFDTDQHREDWRSAAGFIDKTVQDSDLVLFSYPEPFTPYSWYSKNQVSYGATNSISADADLTKEITKELIADKDRIYYFDYLKDLSDPQNIVESTIIENGYEERQVVNFRGIGQVRIWEK